MQNPKTNRSEQEPTAKTPTVKESYVKPQAEIIKLELEQPILQGSRMEPSSAPNWGNGGRW